MVPVKKITIGLLLFCIVDCLGQPTFKAGFRVLNAYDSNRVYKPNTPINHPLHYRPIPIDVWYPATAGPPDSIPTFFDLVKLMEKRANLYDDTRSYDGLSEEILQYICALTYCSNHRDLKKIKTSSYINATPAKGTFPLIIYFCAMNGMSYENYALCEQLAKCGFIVANVSSIGRYPGNMSLDLDDLREQVADAKFIKMYVARSGFRFDNTALVGYSLGGLSAVLAAMMEPNEYTAVVSLNGSDRFVYNGDEDDEKLNLIRTSQIYSPQSLKAAYLYLDSDPKTEEPLPDSVYHFAEFFQQNKLYFKVTGATHEDFSSFAMFSALESQQMYDTIRQLTVRYLLTKLQDKDSVVLDSAMSSRLSQRHNQKEKSGEKTTITIRGKVLDKKTNAPLPYVNIGIAEKDVGTATDSNGYFKLTIPTWSPFDTLKLSMIGYKSSHLLLEGLAKIAGTDATLYLSENPRELEVITVRDKGFRSRVLGNTTTSKFFGGKFASNDLGSEIAIKIHGRKRPGYLNKFQCNISYNTADTAVFRFNIYSAKNGMPDKNIVKENILIPVGNKTGNVVLDLSKHNFMVNGDFFVALEYISGNKNSGIVFSAGFMNNGTYYRKASQGRWRKYPMGVGFNVTTSY